MSAHGLTEAEADALIAQIDADRRALARQAMFAAAYYADFDEDKARAAIALAQLLDPALVPSLQVAA